MAFQNCKFNFSKTCLKLKKVMTFASSISTVPGLKSHHLQNQSTLKTVEQTKIPDEKLEKCRVCDKKVKPNEKGSD